MNVWILMFNLYKHITCMSFWSQGTLVPVPSCTELCQIGDTYVPPILDDVSDNDECDNPCTDTFSPDDTALCTFAAVPYPDSIMCQCTVCTAAECIQKTAVTTCKMGECDVYVHVCTRCLEDETLSTVERKYRQSGQCFRCNRL